MLSQSLEYYPIEVLHWAGMNDQCIDDLKDILNKYPEYINTINNEKDNALTIAARTGNIGIVKYLVENTSIDLQHKTKEGNSLYVALHYNQPEIALYLIEKNIDIFEKDINGQNMLFKAATIGNDNIIEKLLELGLSANELDNYKEHCLFPFIHSYISHKNYYSFELLLSQIDNETLFTISSKGYDILGYMDHLLEQERIDSKKTNNIMRLNMMKNQFELLSSIINSRKSF